MRNNKKAIGAVLLAIALLFILGFRVGHPQSGLTNALGSAESSLVIYQKADTYSVGQKVIAKSLDTSISPFLGEVVAVTGDLYDVGNGSFSQSIRGDRIKGKMIFVIPFIGKILGWVGL